MQRFLARFSSAEFLILLKLLVFTLAALHILEKCKSGVTKLVDFSETKYLLFLNETFYAFQAK